MSDYVPVDLVEVGVWGRRVGAVAFDASLGVYAFEYLPEWVDTGVQLSPLVLPNQAGTFTFPELERATFHGLPGLLADALPDAFGNQVIDAWLVSQNIDKRQITTLDRLAYAGERALGALTFHPPARALTAPVTAIQIADIVTQARAVIAGQVDEKDTTHDTLHQLIQVGSSAGGARAKAVLQYNPTTDQVRLIGHRLPLRGLFSMIQRRTVFTLRHWVQVFAEVEAQETISQLVPMQDREQGQETTLLFTDIRQDSILRQAT